MEFLLVGLEGSCFIANLNQFFYFMWKKLWLCGGGVCKCYQIMRIWTHRILSDVLEWQATCPAGKSTYPRQTDGTEKVNIKQSRLLCGDKYNANCMLTQSKYVFLIQSALLDLRHSISFMAKINSLLKEILTEYYKFTHSMKGHTSIVAFCNHLSSSKQTS